MYTSFFADSPALIINKTLIASMTDALGVNAGHTEASEVVLHVIEI